MLLSRARGASLKDVFQAVGWHVFPTTDKLHDFDEDPVIDNGYTFATFL